MIRPFYEGNDQLIRDEAIRSTALAGMTLMLSAKGLGYDSCPMIGFDSEKVAELINLPDNYLLSFMIPVGKELKPGWERGQRLTEDIVVSYDRF
jgi:nitroreductase